jgi:hypothetical protein
MRPVSRGAVFWGLALITAGIVVLALQQGLLTQDLASQAVDWWPLILIGAGTAIIFSGALGVVATAIAGVLVGVLIGGFIGGAASFPSGCGTGEPQALRAYEDGTLATGAEVDIDLNCVTLEVSAGADQDWTVSADEETADRLEVSADPDRLEVRADDTVTLGSEHRLHVRVVVPGGEGTNLSSSLNAGDATMDLAGGRWGEISLSGNAVAMSVDLSGAEAGDFSGSMNAGSMGISLDEGSSPGSMSLSANAGSFEVCAPDAIGLAITVGENVATGHNLEEAGLTQDGDVWRTADFDSADTQIEISFSGNAASLTLNPEGGCS